MWWESPTVIAIWPWFAVSIIGVAATVSHLWGRALDAYEKDEPPPSLPVGVVAGYLFVGQSQAFTGGVIGWGLVGTLAAIILGALFSSAVNRATFRAVLETRALSWLGGKHVK